MKQQHQLYGSIIPDEDISADEETALIVKKKSTSNISERRNSSSPSYYKMVFVTLALVAAVLAWMSYPAWKAEASVSGAPPAPAFDWKAWGSDIKQFWAEKKA
jgi:hypothetical protein